jgi:hypothetical protein
MRLLSAPRQPFVGLALMAATGIIIAEILPLPSFAMTPAAIILAICILIVACWPRLLATYVVVGAGFFLLHIFQTASTEGQQLADELGSRPRVVTATGCVISEPKVAPSGFATFLLKLKSIKLEGRKQSTHAVWQVRWKRRRLKPVQQLFARAVSSLSLCGENFAPSNRQFQSSAAIL